MREPVRSAASIFDLPQSWRVRLLGNCLGQGLAPRQVKVICRDNIAAIYFGFAASILVELEPSATEKAANAAKVLAMFGLVSGAGLVFAPWVATGVLAQAGMAPGWVLAASSVQSGSAAAWWGAACVSAAVVAAVYQRPEETEKAYSDTARLLLRSLNDGLEMHTYDADVENAVALAAIRLAGDDTTSVSSPVENVWRAFSKVSPRPWRGPLATATSACLDNMDRKLRQVLYVREMRRSMFNAVTVSLVGESNAGKSRLAAGLADSDDDGYGTTFAGC